MTRGRALAPFICRLSCVLALAGAGCTDRTTPQPAASPEVKREISLVPVASGLDTPWSIAFAPDGRTFVTERPGRIRVIDKNGLRPEPWAVVDVLPMTYETEGGLLGIAVAPDFATSGHVFVVGTSAGQNRVFNRVLRFTDRNGQGTDPTTIVDTFPPVKAAPKEERAIHTHIGGALGFGPDGMLYVTYGDATQPELSQDPRSLAGKVLRYKPDGTIPSDNPTSGSPVYALGLRNPQGIGWNRATGDLFAADNGPSDLSWEKQYGGGWFGDELNAIVRGGNYGWPQAVGTASQGNFINPLVEWSPSVAPTGVAVYEGSYEPWKGNVFVTSLRGQRLWRIVVEKSGGAAKVISQEGLLEARIGRIRAVAMAPDGYLYIGSSNRDARGRPTSDDDRIYRVVP
jgi:aldose sugar dehydrogenase